MKESPFELTSPYVIITGGASGIGLSMVSLFNKHGAIVDVFDINKPSNELIEEKEIDKNTVHFHEIDITNQQQVKELVSVIAIQREIGMLINNAGIAHIGNAMNTSEKDFQKIFDVNVKGAYNCIQACLPFMIENG